MKNKKYNINFKGGFTLIETLIYAGLVAFMLAFMVISVYQMIDSRDRLKFQQELVENQKLLNQKLAWLLQNNSAVNSPTAGSSGTSLSVNKIGATDNPYVMSFSGGQLWLATGANPAVNLTNNYVTVSNATFDHLNNGGRSVIRLSAVFSNAVSSTTVETTYLVN